MEKNKNIKHKIVPMALLLVALSFGQRTRAQSADKNNRLEGEVSYATSENIYLRFSTTAPLILGDTVYRVIGNEYAPCLIIQQKSSVSSIAKPIGDCTFNKGDQVVYFYKTITPKKEIATTTVPDAPVDSSVSSPAAAIKEKQQKENVQSLYGRVSVANYTTLSGQDVNNRAMARLSVNVDHIGGSNLSLRSYMNYRQNTVARGESSWNDSRFNVFELALTQSFSETSHLTAGRFIDRKMASIGAIDGISFTKSWKHIYAGIIAGFRPDPLTYSVNTNLLQAGGYIGIYHNAHKSAYTNIGFVNQANGGVTDRRYLFLQHQSTLAKKVYLFSTSEVDLYSIDTAGVSTSTPRITSLYVSLVYRPTTKLSLSASYDIRQNIILYQSYEDRLQNLLDYDPRRTGIRLGATYNFSSRFRTGLNVSFRNQSDNTNAYKGVLAYLSLGELLGHGNLYFALSVNDNTTFKYQSAYLRYMQPMASQKVMITPYYRFLRHHYNLVDVAAALQHFAGLECSFRITKLLSLGAIYEYNLQRDWAYNRFNINLIQRF